jgi:hypothetical protein
MGVGLHRGLLLSWRAEGPKRHCLGREAPQALPVDRKKRAVSDAVKVVRDVEVIPLAGRLFVKRRLVESAIGGFRLGGQLPHVIALLVVGPLRRVV